MSAAEVIEELKAMSEDTRPIDDVFNDLKIDA
jgi:hypothetical protein